MFRSSSQNYRWSLDYWFYMNWRALLALLKLHLMRKKKVNREIASTRLKCQRLLQRYRRALHIQNNLLSCLFMLIDDPMNNSTRLIWSHPKSNRWWVDIVPGMTNKQFKENFRVERSTFMELLQQIGPHLQKNNTALRVAIPVEKRIAASLYLLGSSTELRTIGHLFGIGKSTAGTILHEFCSTLVEAFFHQFVKFPTTDQEIEETMNEFLTKSGYPMCLGSVDGTHIAIKPPLGEECDYFNYKKFHSVIVLAVVNASLKFTYGNIGAPGRCNDSSVFTRSTSAGRPYGEEWQLPPLAKFWGGNKVLLPPARIVGSKNMNSSMNAWSCF